MKSTCKFRIIWILCGLWKHNYGQNSFFLYWVNICVELCLLKSGVLQRPITVFSWCQYQNIKWKPWSKRYLAKPDNSWIWATTIWIWLTVNNMKGNNKKEGWKKKFFPRLSLCDACWAFDFQLLPIPAVVRMKPRYALTQGSFLWIKRKVDKATTSKTPPNFQESVWIIS